MKNIIRSAWIGLFALWMVQTAFGQGLLKDLPGGKWWTNKRIIQELRLRFEQQTRIEALWMQGRRTLAEQKNELEKRQLELAALLGKDAIDEAAALKAFDDMQQARHNLERSTFLMRIQIKNLLTTEQRPIIEAIAERMRQQRAKAGETTASETLVLPVKK